jgi:hypothetical protein
VDWASTGWQEFVNQVVCHRGEPTQNIGQPLDPQRVGYVIRDLGTAQQMQSMIAAVS